MIFSRQLPVGAFDVAGLRRAIDLEEFVVVLKFHIGSFSAVQSTTSGTTPWVFVALGERAELSALSWTKPKSHPRLDQLVV